MKPTKVRADKMPMVVSACRSALAAALCLLVYFIAPLGSLGSEEVVVRSVIALVLLATVVMFQTVAVVRSEMPAAPHAGSVEHLVFVAAGGFSGHLFGNFSRQPRCVHRAAGSRRCAVPRNDDDHHGRIRRHRRSVEQRAYLCHGPDDLQLHRRGCLGTCGTSPCSPARWHRARCQRRRTFFLTSFFSHRRARS